MGPLEADFRASVPVDDLGLNLWRNHECVHLIGFWALRRYGDQTFGIGIGIGIWGLEDPWQVFSILEPPISDEDLQELSVENEALWSQAVNTRRLAI